MYNLMVALPVDWDNTKKGNFFENFVSGVLKPMRFEVIERVRFTGMEIDLLAKGLDQPLKILVECKAHNDPLSADVISKLMGNTTLRGADSSWLFSTSDLSKDGKGQWEEIRENPELSKKFIWYSPQKICDLLVDQGKVKSPKSLEGKLHNHDFGEWTLIIKPGMWYWIGEILEAYTPAFFVCFDAKSGTRHFLESMTELGQLGQRIEPLVQLSSDTQTSLSPGEGRAPVARVVSGDTWEDPRPSRPIDFVGRENLLSEITTYINSVRLGNSQTRAFALQAPSGWGKSSFTLKLLSKSRRGHGLKDCSITAIDSRSATDSAFVAEAVRMAFEDAGSRRFIRRKHFRVASLQYPLSSQDFENAYNELNERNSVIVLIFDQFEELFAKEQLFEVFRAIRDLSLELDANQYPFILGFAWKTDISLPQQHPAYHLWHELSDRRRAFEIPEFGIGEIKRVISKAEKALSKRLSPALRVRLIEQCQGFPWLLKKLLVHVLQRVSTPESQYLLLERELDVEILFHEDLHSLSDPAIRCLEHIARNAPVAVPEIEENFKRDITNMLLNEHLIVRSGMNYVIYWDIFRDYLVEKKVPYIPWGRTFQRDPLSGVRALEAIDTLGESTAPTIASALSLKEGPCFNLLSDLVALQLVDRISGDKYCTASILSDTKPDTIANHVFSQLKRHVVTKSITNTWRSSEKYNSVQWINFFERSQPRTNQFSASTIRHYAANLRRWLLFAGLLDSSGNYVFKPTGRGSLAGILKSKRIGSGAFLATSTPEQVCALLEIFYSKSSIRKKDLIRKPGLRNALQDCIALNLLEVLKGIVKPSDYFDHGNSSIENLHHALKQNKVISFLAKMLDAGITDVLQLGDELELHLESEWSESSKRRYANGLRRYVRWLDSIIIPRQY